MGLRGEEEEKACEYEFELLESGFVFIIKEKSSNEDCKLEKE
jgi:hypothetical protein